MSLHTLMPHVSNVAHAGHSHSQEEMLFAVFVGAIILIFLAAYAVISYLLSRIFKKAGVAAWKAWVPVYSTWITLELGDQKGWWSLLYLASFVTWIPLGLSDYAMMIVSFVTFILSLVGSVFLYMAMYKIGLRFNKEGYFVLWAIFLPIVWYAWLAFDDSTWKKSGSAPLYTPENPVKE